MQNIKVNQIIQGKKIPQAFEIAAMHYLDPCYLFSNPK